MKNSDLKRFFESDASNNNDGFARLNGNGAVNAPVTFESIDTGEMPAGQILVPDGQGGLKGAYDVVYTPAVVWHDDEPGHQHELKEILEIIEYYAGLEEFPTEAEKHVFKLENIDCSFIINLISALDPTTANTVFFGIPEDSESELHHNGLYVRFNLHGSKFSMSSNESGAYEYVYSTFSQFGLKTTCDAETGDSEIIALIDNVEYDGASELGVNYCSGEIEVGFEPRLIW